MVDFKILAFQNPEFQILDDFKILAFQNPEFKILAYFKTLRGSLPKSGPLDFATKITFALFFVGEEALVGVY